MILTEKRILSLKPTAKRQQIMDDKDTGLGLRVTPEGRKFFFFYRKINGRPTFKSIGEFPAWAVDDARKEARAWSVKADEWQKANYDAAADPFAKPKKVQRSSVPTFQELVDAYVEHHIKSEANTPERAEYQARWMAKRHFADWSERPITEISIDDVLTVKNRCGAHRHMANRTVEFAKAIFAWSNTSRDNKINFWPIDKNPAIGVELYPEKPRERFLQPNELVRFNEELKNEPHIDLRDFLTLALSTGARRGNLYSMRWQDIGFELKEWKIPHSKSGESYLVQLLPAAMEVLKRRRATAPEDAAYVFPGVGKTGHLTELKKPWDEFRKRANIPDVRLHDIRRTNASYQAISGVSLQLIGKSLGHSGTDSTEVYAKLHSQAVREAREAGERKMKQMMAAAKRNQKSLASSKKTKMLKAANA